MSVSSVSGTTNSSQTNQTTTTSRDTLTQQDFLNLFMTQMQYQNPLEPMSNTEMATQMAQFSSLQALNNISSTLSNLSGYQYNLNALQSSNLVGKKVEVNGDSLTVKDGSISDGYYQLSASGNVTVQVLDAQGNTVRSMDKGLQDTSKQTVGWDGKDDSGAKVADGTYTFAVSGVDQSGQKLTVNSSMVNTVTGVSFDQGVIYLNFGSASAKMSDLLTILN
jgi:flagellar basal-body rod modification protein FlgD